MAIMLIKYPNAFKSQKNGSDKIFTNGGPINGMSPIRTNNPVKALVIIAKIDKPMNIAFLSILKCRPISRRMRIISQVMRIFL
jgi:hypothetical protein